MEAIDHRPIDTRAVMSMKASLRAGANAAIAALLSVACATDPGSDPDPDDSGTTEATDANTDPGTETEVGATTTGEPGQTCADWAAPPGACETPGSAQAWVTIPFDMVGPGLVDAPCTVTTVEAFSMERDDVTLMCAQPQTFEIVSMSPHLDLPLQPGQEVLLSTSDAFEDTQGERIRSFVIRSTEGDLLLAWVNLQSDTVGSALVADVDIAPLAATIIASGCDATFDTECSNEGGDGATALQRGLLALQDDAATEIFDGHDATISVGDDAFAVIVDAAIQITCRDPGCGDDTGPFNEASFLIVSVGGYPGGS
jgi:hypothetical protein